MSREARVPSSSLRAAACVAAAAVSGCAAIPDVTVTYRPVRWSIAIATAHTITCTANNDIAIVERSAVVVPAYGADPAGNYTIRLADLQRHSADTDFTVAFTEDGRLRSINQSSTGQGEAVAKAAVSTLAAFAGARASVATPPRGAHLLLGNLQDKRLDPSAQAICAVVSKWSVAQPNQLRRVSLTQGATISGPGLTHVVAAKTSPDQAELLADLKRAGSDLAASISISPAPDASGQPIAAPRDRVGEHEVALTLQQSGRVKVLTRDAQGQLDERTVAVPLPQTFVLPIPKAALFGKQTFKLTLAESGRITEVGYGSTSGMAGALGAAGAAAGAEVAIDKAEAEALKAASDLIVQQQRAHNCRLDPVACK